MTRRNIEYCINHPDVASDTHCTRCSRSICYNCTMSAGGRDFCSTECYVAFIFKSGIRNLIKWPAKAIKGLARGLKGRKWRTLVDLVLIAGFIILLVITLQTRRRLADEKGGGTQVFETTPDSSAVSPPKLFDPSVNGVVHSGTLSIRGEAEANRIVSLSIDGILQRVVLPRGHAFEFNEIKLNRGQNKLEVRAISPNGESSILQTILIRYENPTINYLARDFSRGSRASKSIALTFDGGAADNAAAEILDLLQKEGIRSTFFLTGEFIRRYPEVVKRIKRENHEIGNHTWTHPHLTTFAENRRHDTIKEMTEEKLNNELVRAATLYHMITGADMSRIWRAPFGEYNDEILMWAARSGYRHVGWTTGRGWRLTMDTMDWVADTSSSAYYSSEEIVNKILQIARTPGDGAGGGIILMHLGTNRKDDQFHKKLPDMIRGLEEEGYTFCTISELMAEAGN